jgi:N-acetyl sugar amidotransferase
VDWAGRSEEFSRIVRRAKDKKARYDCLIPVSGGKDSTWQVVTCLERGLHPLTVSWRPPARTEIGRRNLDNLIRLGVDHVDFSINPSVEARFLRASLERFGSTAIPMHLGLFNIPLTLAVLYRIPLVVWGENSAVEYGAGAEPGHGHRLDEAWLKRYGVTHGTTAEDWVSAELSRRDLTPYVGPTGRELEAAGVEAVFLGYYFPWDPAESLRVATVHGFTARAEGPKTGYYDYADIDDDFISIHHYLKWHKFGFTRLFDNLSLEIRNGRMSREEAVRTIAARGDPTPREDIAHFCRFVGWSEREFHSVADRFRNPAIWRRVDGVWVMPEFLIKEWSWHER